VIVTIDFETYYDKEYSLSKMTTEEYIRDDRFEVIGVAIKVDDGDTIWCANEVDKFLAQFDWDNLFVLAHNMVFDGAILSWRYGIKPKAYLDTLCMARAVDGAEVGNSLAKLADRYGIGKKGTEVILAMGKRKADFNAQDLHQYGEYCRNDVGLTYALYNILKESYNLKELKLIDLTVRMFTDPVLRLDLPLLEQHLEDVKARKEELLTAANVSKQTLMSQPKFAELLESMGVEVPMKISPTTGKLAPALAKSDDGFKTLLEHHDMRVQTLAAARLGTKSTLEETRTERLISIAKRGSLPVPLRYYAAHTGRWGGDDKLNLQNLPSRGENAGKLKKSIMPPEGYVLIDADSSQIEARTLAWLAGQTDLVQAFEDGEDVYQIMASRIYNKPVKDVKKAERFVGKTVVLGCGYGLGHKKFMMHMKSVRVDMSDLQAQYTIRRYRETFPFIPALWESASRCLEALASTDLKTYDFCKQPQAVSLLPGVGFDIPSGMPIRYINLRETGEKFYDGTPQYIYDTRKGVARIYGGKVVENICQAVARCVIGEQMLRVAKRYRVVLTVHDAIACIAPVDEREEAVKYVEECMRWRPKWAETLPLNCEVGYGESYGDC
jgi:DNA polymerase I-like protein with 3'-5' exonuclease and polymerase domains